jgi:hypothetical protein
MHWFNFQVFILMHITYQWNLDFVAIEPRSKIFKEIHYYFFDEKDHDTFFV